MAPSDAHSHRESAVRFLLERVDYERSALMPYGRRDFKLDRMRRLMHELGDPQAELRIVHVAGTKGKGSTAAMTAAMLSAAGRRIGLFSSPHLDRVEERLVVGGRSCTSDDLARLVERVRPVVEQLDAEAGPASHGPTYFEILTAMAIVYFADESVDAAVLEVGLGGRLDSTNICSPVVSVITSISFDHTLQLGNTLCAIAREKAGIIKPGVPVISGVRDAEPRAVVESIARERGSRLLQLRDELTVGYRPPDRLELHESQGTVDVCCRAPGLEFEYCNVALNLLGEHQADNAALALAAVAEFARGAEPIAESALRQGLAGVDWPARIEVLSRAPVVILDSAHNLASIEALVAVLERCFSPSPQVLVFATTRDKDVAGMLRVLAPRFDRVVLTRYQSNPRGVPIEQLANYDVAWRAAPVLCPDPASAWDAVCRLATPDTLLCITGSFFIASEMRAQFRQRPLTTSDRIVQPA